MRGSFLRREVIDAYQELKPARVEMILRRLDEVMMTATTEPIAINATLTVEHIMPQAWKDHWPLPAKRGEALFEYAKKAWPGP